MMNLDDKAEPLLAECLSKKRSSLGDTHRVIHSTLSCIWPGYMICREGHYEKA